jgi:ribosomal RNA-processing protein 36
MHKTELSTLKENLKRAKKMSTLSPHNQREEREQEVAKLEQAVKRAESNVNKDKREHVEHDALRKAKQEEKEQRKAGKGAWHMKDGKAKCSWPSHGR